ncbi:uncharacterized protein LOC112083984 [Eutrema salsugineum]|uniref:uncharacterized protein LOC112083984 n=1 Tax=Eutrema salsugineum TaxID=72664 RepID=UPI000CED0A79|nr:uncharacterized protein LOC112083984 [Eutrema salsugineum]
MTSVNNPPLKRIRAAELDTSELEQENRLTIIGRLTNPGKQQLWGMITFLPKRWDLRGKAFRADLGQGCFQYHFDFEYDLQKVLDNRPYHYSEWMVILQRWEPVISPDFPSQIPFWIELKGIPLHYWRRELLRKFGRELGVVEDINITKGAAKIKVRIDGLQPLTKATILELPGGMKAIVNLHYEKLKKHCSIYHILSREKESCPQNSDMADQREKREPSGRKRSPPPKQRGHHSKRNAYRDRLDRHDKPFGPRPSQTMSRQRTSYDSEHQTSHDHQD